MKASRKLSIFLGEVHNAAMYGIVVAYFAPNVVHVYVLYFVCMYSWISSKNLIGEYETCEKFIRETLKREDSSLCLDLYLRPMFKALQGNYGKYTVCCAVMRDTIRDHRMYPLCTREHLPYAGDYLNNVITKVVFALL